MASSENIVPISLTAATAGTLVGEWLLPKYEIASANATYSAVAAILGILVSGVTFGFTRNMEISVASGSFLIGISANRGWKWMTSVH